MVQIARSSREMGNGWRLVATAISAAAAAQLFATGNGVPPTSGINIINNNSVGGAALDAASVSPSTQLADYNVDGALCLRLPDGGRGERGLGQGR